LKKEISFHISVFDSRFGAKPALRKQEIPLVEYINRPESTQLVWADALAWQLVIGGRSWQGFSVQSKNPLITARNSSFRQRMESRGTAAFCIFKLMGQQMFVDGITVVRF